jgi:hypothetical protein
MKREGQKTGEVVHVEALSLLIPANYDRGRGCSKPVGSGKSKPISIVATTFILYL